MSAAPRVFPLHAADGLCIEVTDVGAAWLSCQVPVGEGTREVLLGHPGPADVLTRPGYLGVVVGRYANRIAGASFELDGRRVQLAANEGQHQLHGGPDGFHRRRWDLVSHTESSLELSLSSPDGDQGFPGQLDVRAIYRVQPMHVSLSFSARATAPTPVCLSSHAYFNLDGSADRGGRIDDHRLQIAGSRYLPVRPDLIPVGDWARVDDTPFDFRQPRPIGAAIAALQATGARPATHDHCWVLDAPGEERAAAVLRAGDGLLGMALHTDAPGLQFYAGEFLPETVNRLGQPQVRHGGLALEPQCMPDSPNHPEWRQASCILRPGQVYRQRLVYRFFPADPA